MMIDMKNAQNPGAIVQIVLTASSLLMKQEMMSILRMMEEICMQSLLIFLLQSVVSAPGNRPDRRNQFKKLCYPEVN